MLYQKSLIVKHNFKFILQIGSKSLHIYISAHISTEFWQIYIGIEVQLKKIATLYKTIFSNNSV